MWGIAYKIEKSCEKLVRRHLDAREQGGYEVVMVRKDTRWSGHGKGGYEVVMVRKDTRWSW